MIVGAGGVRSTRKARDALVWVRPKLSVWAAVALYESSGRPGAVTDQPPSAPGSAWSDRTSTPATFTDTVTNEPGAAEPENGTSAPLVALPSAGLVRVTGVGSFGVAGLGSGSPGPGCGWGSAGGALTVSVPGAATQLSRSLDSRTRWR